MAGRHTLKLASLPEVPSLAQSGNFWSGSDKFLKNLYACTDCDRNLLKNLYALTGSDRNFEEVCWKLVRLTDFDTKLWKNFVQTCETDKPCTKQTQSFLRKLQASPAGLLKTVQWQWSWRSSLEQATAVLQGQALALAEPDCHPDSLKNLYASGTGNKNCVATPSCSPGNSWTNFGGTLEPELAHSWTWGLLLTHN